MDVNEITAEKMNESCRQRKLMAAFPMVVARFRLSRHRSIPHGCMGDEAELVEKDKGRTIIGPPGLSSPHSQLLVSTYSTFWLLTCLPVLMNLVVWQLSWLARH